MRIAVVVQRYGLEVAGGAELHARYVAEMLSRRHDVTVLTTTASDYVTWAEHYPPGPTRIGDVAVLRFPVERTRDLHRFAAAADAAFAPAHSLDDELRYLTEQGPVAPRLTAHLEAHGSDYDAVVAFSFRYSTSQEAARVVPRRTLLVPTAEEDPAVSLETSKRLFRGVGAIAYNSHEERAMIVAAADNGAVPGDVVGVFSRIPEPTTIDAERFRRRYQVAGPYLLYVGRIDRNKGCVEMFDDFAEWSAEAPLPHQLLLIGQPVLEIPLHPAIRHLGFVDDQTKYDALAGADALLMPSAYESLSMVTLEAMALAVVPLVNGRCAVLRGQVRRSNAGLYYEGYDQFFEALTLLLQTPRLRTLLGANGQRFYREHYTEPVIAAKYEALLTQLVG